MIPIRMSEGWVDNDTGRGQMGDPREGLGDIVTDRAEADAATHTQGPGKRRLRRIELIDSHRTGQGKIAIAIQHTEQLSVQAEPLPESDQKGGIGDWR